MSCHNTIKTPVFSNWVSYGFEPSFPFPEHLHCCYIYFHCSYLYNYYNYLEPCALNMATLGHLFPKEYIWSKFGDYTLWVGGGNMMATLGHLFPKEYIWSTFGDFNFCFGNIVWLWVIISKRILCMIHSPFSFCCQVAKNLVKSSQEWTHSSQCKHLMNIPQNVRPKEN
jgi:hypothetical protein